MTPSPAASGPAGTPGTAGRSSTFRRGSIFANGWVGGSNTFPVPVTNGTGIYTNAHGTVLVTGTRVGDDYHFSFST